MGSMVLDVVRVNAFILPNLTKAKTTLNETAKYGNSVQRYAGDSPISSRKNMNAARVRNLASDLTKRLGVISNNVNTITTKLDAKLEKAKLIEKKNKAKSTALSAAVGAVAGAAGAAIGAATGGIKGAVVGAAIGAAAGVAAKKTNVFSSIGKALKNTGAKIAKNVGSFFSGVWKGIKNIGKSIVNACKKIAKKVVSFVKEKIGPIIKAIGKGIVAVGKFLFKTAATIVNLAVSLVEGIVSFVEAIGDVVLIVVGGVCSIVTAVADIVRGVCTGEWDWKCTKAVWTKWIMPWVGYDWTSKAFDYAAPVLSLGLDKYAFDWAKRGATGYKIGKGVGYVVGIVVASIFTAGGAGAVAGAGGAAAGGVTGTVSTFVAGGASAVAGVASGATTIAAVSAASTAAGAISTTAASTAFAGIAKAGQEVQKGYNKLSDEEKQNLGSIGRVIGASAVKGGIEAATWYVTYGGGGKNLMAKHGSKLGAKFKGVDKLGQMLTNKNSLITGKHIGQTAAKVANKILPSVNVASLTKAGIQAGKAYANEAASVIADGDFDLESANTSAIIGAGTSFVYDNTFGSWFSNAHKIAEEAKNANTASTDAAGMIPNQGGEAVKQSMKESIKSKLTDIAIKVDPITGFAGADEGGKKIVGGGIKSWMKDVGNNLIPSA